MKKNLQFLITLLALCLLSLDVTAQEENERLTISGRLIDSDLKEPMVQATVQLFTAADSTFVGGSMRKEISPWRHHRTEPTA